MTDAAGIISEAQEDLRRTLADVPAWRAFCRARDQAGARGHIHQELIPTPAGEKYTDVEIAAYWPYAITATQRFGYRLDSVDSFAADGSLWLMIGDRVDTTLTDAEQDRRFLNAVGKIIAGLAALAVAVNQAEHYIAVTGIEMPEPPVRGHPDDDPEKKGEEIMAMLLIQWGTAQ